MKNRILMFLSAHIEADVRVGIDLWEQWLRGVKADVDVDSVKHLETYIQEVGWTVYNGPPDVIPGGHEWQEINGRVYVRPIETARLEYLAKTKSEKAKKAASNPPTEPGVSPKCRCGGDLYPHPVCPNCEAGKIGMTIEWVCGDNSEHVFYSKD